METVLLWVMAALATVVVGLLLVSIVYMMQDK